MSDTIDPNDLDSIDALLDEAEQEIEQNPVEEDTPETVSEPDLPAEESTASEASPESDIFEAFTEDDESAPVSARQDISAPEPESEPEPEPEPIRVPDDGIPPKTEPVAPPVQQAVAPEVDPEEILAQRKKKQANSTPADTANNLSVNEMEAIKKLIIIFSSVLIVIGLTTIGLSTWAAISASHKLDEETKQTLEDIKTASNESATGALEVKKEIKGLHKKLDALSFQLEQLNGDLGNMMDGLSKVEANAQPSHAVHEAEAAHGVPHSAVAPEGTSESTQPVIAKMDPELMKKMREVNRNVIKVQKRILEINRRIKRLQAESRGVIKEVKQVQKTLLQQQVEKKKAKKQKKVDDDTSEKLPKVNAIPNYIYQAPDYSY